MKRLERNNYLFENGLKITLGNDIIAKYNLKGREELSEKEYSEVLELATLSTSYYYLAKRDYSKKELFDKLYQRYREKEIILKVLNLLESKEYINDYEFALNYIKYRKGSKKKIEYELYQKGITKEIISEIIREFDDSEELEREWNRLGDRELSKKIASLMRKGFSYNKIKKIIDRGE